MAKRRVKADSSNDADDEGSEFTFDPGVQQELDLEETCCVTGEKIESSFARYPDYINSTMMVMSKEVMLKHLRANDSLEKFLEVLAERHGPEVVKDYTSKPEKR
jgi:hypothetical protein